MQKIHLEHCNVKCVEQISGKTVNKKTLPKKITTFFGDPSQRYQVLRHFLKNPKIPKNLMYTKSQLMA